MDPVKHNTRIIVGMSGGVDSSVAACLLQQQGYDVQGLFMKNWEEDDSEEVCSAAEDLADATQVCETLDIPLHTVNFSAEYWERVFEYFLAEISAGRTPNPDVMCNTEIKFKAFLDHALRLGAEYIATGHYAGISRTNDVYHLMKAADDNKEQSYFLYGLGQHQLARTLFPLADINKEAVRNIATRAGFSNHAKKDSTGICFIGERNFREFIGRYLPDEPGDIKTPEGDIVGQHNGVMYYTIGQRQGLGIGGLKTGTGQPWYVAAKDLENNILIAVQDPDHPLLFADSLVASDIHWISGTPPDFPLHCSAKVRYRQSDQICSARPDNTDNDSLVVRFSEPQRAITPGQSVVFYNNRECLGGGIINKAFNH